MNERALMPAARKPYSSGDVLRRAEKRLGLLSERSGWLFALMALVVTTMAATPLSFMISTQSLVLLYVLAVVVTALRHGSGPALLVAFAGLLAHNFFFTVPHFGFGLPPDEVESLVFLFLIALACGPAASRIRNQFIQLRQINRHLEAMRLLGQDLSVAEEEGAVWEHTARELRVALQAECYVYGREGDGWELHPARRGLDEEERAAVDWCIAERRFCGRFSDHFETLPWSVFPLVHGERCVAVLLVRFLPTLGNLQPFERELIKAMLQQAGDTWGRIHLSHELENTRVQAEMERLRAALLSSVSHDLKSPLAAIMGAAETVSVLDKQLSSADRLELVNMIRQEGHRLDSYIQNLLDMTRLENGTLKIDRDWVSVSDLVGSAIGRLKRYFAEPPRIEFRGESDIPLLYVNPALLEQALFNILENAVKFTPPRESIDIEVKRLGDTCRICVEDKGPGIPEHLREQVFDMFYVIAEGDHKKSGTGMGLAICRGMVAAHGGKVWVEPGGNGRGTRFIVELPVVYPEDEDQDLSEVSA